MVEVLSWGYACEVLSDSTSWQLGGGLSETEEITLDSPSTPPATEMPWHNLQNLGSKAYTCGHCGNVVASVSGYHNSEFGGRTLYICPHCIRPTYFSKEGQLPGVAPGSEIEHLPLSVAALYKEARNCVAATCYTAAVLTARKLLMHIGVEQGAAPNQTFLAYVDHLAASGFVPPNGKAWVDHIRLKGNEATHEVVLMTQSDAEDLLAFLGMLLKFIYEFPSKVPRPTRP